MVRSAESQRLAFERRPRKGPEKKDKFRIVSSFLGIMHEAEQGCGKADDQRWFFAGSRGAQNLAILERVMEAGDAEDMLIECWAEFLKHSPSSPAYCTLSRAVAKLDYTRKLLSSMAREQDQWARDDFLQKVQQLHGPSQLVFADETHRDDRTLNRRYGYSKKGQPAYGKRHFLLRGKRYSAVGPFCMEGFLA